MKKALSVALALALMLSMVACGSTDPTPPVDAEQPPLEQSTDPDVETQEVTGPSQIAEAVVWECDEVRVTAKEIDHSGLMGPEVKLLIENLSDHDIIVQSDRAIVNGYTISPTLSADVLAGKKATEGLILMESDLSDCGIGKFTDISFNLYVLDPNTYTRSQESEMIHLTTNYTGIYEQEYDQTGGIIYESDMVKVICQRIIDDGALGPKVMLYIENKSDSELTLQTDGVAANGFMVTGFFSPTVLPGTRCVDDLLISSSDMEENEIDLITELEFALKVIDSSTFQTIEQSDILSLTFS